MAEKCVRCLKINDRPNRQLCSKCNEKQRTAQKKIRNYRIQNRICVWCTIPLPEDETHTMCWECRQKCSQGAKQRKKKSVDAIAVEEKKITIADIVKICTAEGISYGQYMARQQLKNGGIKNA